MKRIILASTSPRRQELMAKLGIPFKVIPGDYEEDMTLNMPSLELAKFLSLGKAQSVAGKEQGIIIGSDTFLAFEDKVLGKPHTAEKAKEVLIALRGKQHSVLTGYAVIDTETGTVINDVVEAKVFFNNYSDQDIDSYIATGEPLERAGGYAIQGGGAGFVEKVEGDYDSIVGLPVKDIAVALKGLGISIENY